MKTYSFAVKHLISHTFGSDTVVIGHYGHQGIAWADNKGPADKMRTTLIFE